MIPNNIEDAKICWIDKAAGVLLAWWGGLEIKAYKIKETAEVKTYVIEKPYKPDYPSFTQVKKRMREIINNNN